MYLLFIGNAKFMMNFKNCKVINFVYALLDMKSAGLSSSSALVCCSGLATVHGNGLELSKVWTV